MYKKNLTANCISNFKKAMALGSIIALATTTVACSSMANDNKKDGADSYSPDNNQAKPKANGQTQTEGSKPNIVYIVLDDTGFSDLGCYGSEIATPNIDRIAANGLRYNNFHVAPVSSPTRAALLTGRNVHSVGVSRLTNFNLGVSHSTGEMTHSAATVAEILKDDSYNTMAVGKWHLTPGWEQSAAGPYDQWPLGRGFERYYGFLDGLTDQYAPDLVYDNHKIDAPDAPDYHLSEDLVDKTIEFIQDQTSVAPDKPFMLNLAFGATHKPVQAPKEYIDKYEGVYDKGWDKIQEQRFARQKELGIVPQNAELAPRDPSVKAWDELTSDQKRLYARFQQVYAGFLDHTDVQVGRLLEALETMGRLEDTMIVLISDNGASPDGKQNGNSMINKSHNGLPYTVEANLAQIEKLGLPGNTTQYPKGWAHVSNTPFQFYKFSANYLGGIRVPLIISWPKVIKDKGAIRNQFCNAIDITPTVLDVIDIEAPKVYNGIQQMPMHGKSIANTFNDAKAASSRDTQYFEIFGQRGLYHQGWFANTIHKKGEPYENDTWELYNLEEDFAQVNNIADKYPDKLKELQQLWNSEAEKYGVFPLDDKTTGGLLMSEMAKICMAKDHITLYPGVSHLGVNDAIVLGANRSHTITVKVDRPDKNTEGVLTASGGNEGGFTFYVKDNRLVYEYNFFGKIFKVESNIDVPTGSSVLSVDYKNAGLLKANVTLYINDQEVGVCDLPKVFPITPGLHEGMDAGCDRKTPVSPSYKDKGIFKFNGKLEKIDIDLEDDYDWAELKW